MPLKFFNTAQRRVEDFVPLVDGQVSMYCCGPTVYNYAHIGNLRTYLFEDFLRRALEYLGFQVLHVMNVTDVGHLSDDGDEGEDKMLKGARERGMSVWEIAQFFSDAFFKDSERLAILRPKVVCPATQHIDSMIALIHRLEEKGLTYLAGGNVYFDTSKFPEYGKMALLDRQEVSAVSRVSHDRNKKNSRDFVLWFTKSKFESQAMLWDSPWGRGYPGWHIECSAMSMQYLGEKFDIHCGGIDHISVHQTNEIAQSEGAIGHPWVHYWLHGEFLLLSKEKMSKSTGDFLTLQSLVDQGYDPLDYRWFCLGAHYRSPLTFSAEGLDGARNARNNLNEKVLGWKKIAEPQKLGQGGLEYRARWVAALENDLALPQALSVVWAVVKDASLGTGEKLTLLYEMDKVLGMGWQALTGDKSESVPAEILTLVEERQAARQIKDWARSDAVREKLKQLGWTVEDSPAGPLPKRIV
ncbi:MAG: cysteine--tRNA ligase [Spirochaetales bacterium]|nr:cysteine--tRNA ligase [Spirochaetales bacterium]